MDQTAQKRTLKMALDDAALAGFAVLRNTYEAGQHVSVSAVRAHVPVLSVYREWDEEDRLIADIDQFVAEHGDNKREDDPRVQHEGAYL